MAKKSLKKVLPKEKTKLQIVSKVSKEKVKLPIALKEKDKIQIGSKEAPKIKPAHSSVKVKLLKTKGKKEKLFLPFDYGVYKENKVALMKAQLGVLRCLRNIENIKKLQDTKRKLKRELRVMLISSKKNFTKAISDMPNVTGEIEEESHRKASTKIDLSSYQRSEYKIEETNPLNQELTDIQNKIKKLSTYQR
jgi:hypothetical protein